MKSKPFSVLIPIQFQFIKTPYYHTDLYKNSASQATYIGGHQKFAEKFNALQSGQIT